MDAFTTAKPHRLVIAHPPAAGKTRIAIACAQAIHARRILVVATALARGVWVREFAKWSSYDCHALEQGRARMLNGKLRRKHHDAWNADVRVVSYQLLRDVMEENSEPLDFVIFDEIHNLRDPLSKVSARARDLLAANPNVPCLGLTATPIPTEVQQAWNPIDVLFPGWFGNVRSNGDIPWRFLAAFCERNENEYGVAYRGEKSPESTRQLRDILAPKIRRVSDSELLGFLPAVDAQPLYIDNGRTADHVVARDFVQEHLDAETSHIAVVCYNRETCGKFVKQLQRHFGHEHKLYTFDGTTSTHDRMWMIGEFETSGGILVCTCESIRESISLAFVKAAVIFQWRSSPAQALQLLGRFRRPSADPRANIVRYVVKPEEFSRAKMLERRFGAIERALQSDESQDVLTRVFGPRIWSADDLDAILDRVDTTSNPSASEQW